MNNFRKFFPACITPALIPSILDATATALAVETLALVIRTAAARITGRVPSGSMPESI